MSRNPSYPSTVPAEVLRITHFVIALYAGYNRDDNGRRLVRFFNPLGMCIWSHAYGVGRSEIPTNTPAVPVDVSAGYLRILATEAKRQNKYSEGD